jgi:hypothetical protein
MARARSPRVSPCHRHGAAHRRRGGQFCRECSRGRCASSAAKAKHLGWQSARLVSGSSRPYFRAALVLNLSLNSRTRNRRRTSAEFACHRHHRAGVGRPGELRQPVVPDQREQLTDVAGRCADLRGPGPALRPVRRASRRRRLRRPSGRWQAADHAVPQRQTVMARSDAPIMKAVMKAGTVSLTPTRLPQVGRGEVPASLGRLSW